MHRPRALWIVVATLTLGACATAPRGGGYYLDDGPGQAPRDLADIPDAVPRDEPRSARGNRPYTVFGVSYTPLADARGYRERGVASWYGKKFHGRPTSSGEPYDMYAMTAAHKTLPLPTYVRVRNLNNGQSVVVRVNDRGPFLHNRLIDLSYAAASKLGIAGAGTGLVEVEVIDARDSAIQLAADKPAPARGIDLVARAEAAPLPPVTRVDSAAPVLYVQVGAFRDRNNALALRARLEKQSFRPVVLQTDDTGAIHRVRIGPLASVEDGDNLTQRLADAGLAGSVLIVE